MDFDKQKRQQRFKNKNRRDAQKHTRQINREKSTAKAYRPKFDYNPTYLEEDEDDDWHAYLAD